MRPGTSSLAVEFLLVVTTLGAVSGCGSGRKTVPLAEVEGTVTIGGKAVPGLEVAFYPVTQGEDALPIATGKTDAEGKYRLMNSNGKPGAAVGQNRVVVSWPDRERSDDPARPQRRPAFNIPIRYTVASMTPFVMEVKSGGPNTINLQLEPM
jgi:hypothetical protein